MHQIPKKIKPAISVIIPIYNVASYIERCTRSLMEQSFQNVEFIFVNDCTTDNSIDILNKTLEDYPQRQAYVKIIHNQQNKGLAATRFIGMEEAEGEYIWHCDSDDWAENDMLQKMHDKAIGENADIVCCEITKEYAGHTTHCHYDYDTETLDNGLLGLSISEIHIAVWNKLIRRELYTQNGIKNYDGINMGEDSAITVRLRYFSKKTVIIHEPLYHYNRMNTSSMIANIEKKAIEERIKLAQLIENFFMDLNREKEFRKLINFYKFDSKQFYLRKFHDIKRWRSIYPECHTDIFNFKHLTAIGKIKWWLCAHFPLIDIFMKKQA